LLSPGGGGGGPAPDYGGGGQVPRSFDSGGGGTTRGDRNNNPGNIKFGPHAKAFGATGADDKGFAIFPNRESGEAAQETLLKSNRYKGLTLQQFAGKYAEGSPDWARTVGKELGIGPGDIVDNQDPRLAGAIRKAEGTGRGGSGGSPPGAGGPGAPPDAVLKEAEQVAHQGPGAVSQYMASAGYPKSGAWCGEFAASVIKRAGGKPPANPQVASNWRNYGTQVDTPQPGDVAVRRPEFHGRLGTGRTGDTGSHVTIVDAYDPKTGMMTVIGGNQGTDRQGRDKIVTQMEARKYQFFRAKPTGMSDTEWEARKAKALDLAKGGTYSEGNKLEDFTKHWSDAAGRGNVSPDEEKYASDLAKQRRALDMPISLDGRRMDSDRDITVNGRGKLEVEINGPPGVRAKASGDGLLQDTTIQQEVQMAPASKSAPSGEMNI
jgi:uncharacterized protein (TIGR02594 family)